jgi:hypothetical protein
VTRVTPVFGFPTGGTGNIPNMQVTGFSDVNGDFHVSDDVLIDGDLTVSGAKSFIQPHPLDPSAAIKFICLEGNEAGTYFRGSSTLQGGSVTIDVPEDFSLVTEEKGLTVQLTPRGAARLWVESVSLDQVVVRGDTDVAFDYMVNGVRRGFMDVKIQVENTYIKPNQRGVPAYMDMPLAWRLILVQNGILNADFTPNEATYAKNGWKLIDPVPSK